MSLHLELRDLEETLELSCLRRCFGGVWGLSFAVVFSSCNSVWGVLEIWVEMLCAGLGMNSTCAGGALGPARAGAARFIVNGRAVVLIQLHTV